MFNNIDDDFNKNFKKVRKGMFGLFGFGLIINLLFWIGLVAGILFLLKKFNII
jgi:hypothetical protein